MQKRWILQARTSWKSVLAGRGQEFSGRFIRRGCNQNAEESGENATFPLLTSIFSAGQQLWERLV